MIRIIAGKYRGRKLEVPDVVVTASGSDGNGRANARTSDQSERKPLVAARGAKPQSANYKVRPTSSRTREAVFSILTHFAHRDGKNIIHGAAVLDLFCGSGAMGFEALSRGAVSAMLIDNDRKVISAVQKSAVKFGAIDEASVLCKDCTSLLEAKQKFNLVFIDPPYGKVNLEKCIEQLPAKGWVESGAVVVLELPKEQVFKSPEGFVEVMDRTYGIARIIVLEVV